VLFLNFSKMGFWPEILHIFDDKKIFRKFSDSSKFTYAADVNVNVGVLLLTLRVAIKIKWRL